MKEKQYIINGKVTSCPTLAENNLELVKRVTDSLFITKNKDGQIYILRYLSEPFVYSRFKASKLIVKEDGSVNSVPTSDIYYQYIKLVYDKEAPFEKEAYKMPFFGK